MKQWPWITILTATALLAIAISWGNEYVRSRFGYGAPLTSAFREPDPDATVRSLERITGAGSLDELIGKRVELSATAEQVSAETAFWAPVGDAPVLVVVSRDRRDELERVDSEFPRSGIQSAAAGQHMQVSGAIERVPAPESRFDWGLYDPRHHGHLDAKVYVEADAARPE